MTCKKAIWAKKILIIFFFKKTLKSFSSWLYRLIVTDNLCHVGNNISSSLVSLITTHYMIVLVISNKLNKSWLPFPFEELKEPLFLWCFIFLFVVGYFCVCVSETVLYVCVYVLFLFLPWSHLPYSSCRYIT